MVQTVKRAVCCSKGSTSIQQRLDTFLLAYRNTPHATTKESPAMLFLHRRLRTRFDLLKPNVASVVEKAQGKLCQRRQVHAKERTFAVGDKVLVRDYRQGKKWMPGMVSAKTCPVSYTIDVGLSVHRKIQPLGIMRWCYTLHTKRISAILNVPSSLQCGLALKAILVV